MLEFFRRHSGALMIGITIVIIISFSTWGGWRETRGQAPSPTDIAFSIYGKEYSRAEMDRSQRKFMLARMLGLEFATGIVMAAYDHQTRDGSPIDFTFNLIVLEQQMMKLGIRPTDTEALDQMQKLPAFQKEGKFDQAQAAMIEENLGAYGFTSADLLEIVKFDIGFRKLKDLVTANYLASPTGTQKRYASQYQTINASTIAFALPTYETEVTVTDEEIQAYFDENKDSFMTAEKRAAQWVFFELPAEIATTTDPAEQNKKRADFIEKVRQFTEATMEPGARLEPLAVAQKIDLKTASPFTEAQPAEALKDAPQVVSAIFSLDMEAIPLSEPIETPTGFYIAELTAVEPPAPQQLADVKSDIQNLLTQRKAKEAMANAVNEARDKVAAGLKEGKKLDALAAELKLTVSPVAEFTPMEPPPGLSNAYQIAQAAEGTPAGEVSKPVTTDTGVLLVVVNQREVRKRPEGDTTKDNVRTAIQDGERNQIFSAWFSDRKKEAGLKLNWTFG